MCFVTASVASVDRSRAWGAVSWRQQGSAACSPALTTWQWPWGSRCWRSRVYRSSLTGGRSWVSGPQGLI